MKRILEVGFNVTDSLPAGVEITSLPYFEKSILQVFVIMYKSDVGLIGSINKILVGLGVAKDVLPSVINVVDFCAHIKHGFKIKIIIKFFMSQNFNILIVF